ncbi:hypothetical protein [Methylobacterium longum]|jgi:hypothetical protein|uniref:Uncharacterized protein n=1 Tax=Methylobacterium longum TaxID=767694 RepID=A0ABT8AZ89_9HYPH|nr:hypothetical protein [Methylobacterium longum]MDN3574574.1 hypothetical protein [Methylobacterium longum]GJE14838.1 hypothetical protein FOHLNKBM_5913 [Methylobacterium longum]
MTEQVPRVAREFHVGPAGDRYALTRDLKTGEPYVLHRPCESDPEVQLDLGSFLVLFRGQERDDLLQLIGSLLPDDEQPVRDGLGVVRPARFMSRWMPSRQD